MSVGTWALINDGVVSNTIVIDGATAAAFRARGVWPPEQVEVDITELDPRPGIGWAYDGAFHAPSSPPALVSDRDAIPADGATVAVVTYSNTRDDAPAEVTFTVNGTASTVTLDAGTAELDVVAVAPGQITVECDGLTVTITAEEV